MEGVPVADVSIEEIVQRVIDAKVERDLIAASACVANSITIGLGVMIVGTMMENDLRRALCLKPGELVNFSKRPSASGDGK
jgi:hypothetical protein